MHGSDAHRPDCATRAEAPMASESGEISRRGLLAGLGASALLAACGQSAAGGVVVDASAGASGAPDALAGASDAEAVDAGAADLGVAEVGVAPNAIPSLTPNESFFITSCCETPQIDITTWKLDILDRGVLKAWLDKTLIKALAPRDKEHTLERISAGPGNPRMSNALWTGLPLLEIFATLGVKVPPGVTGLKITAHDGYSTAIPIQDLQRPVWLVWRMGGQPLPPAHGFPARLLVPGRYGMKSPKWLKSLEFIDTPYEGYWESFGWSDAATYRPCTFIVTPRAEAPLKAGSIRVLGMAFAGLDPVAEVELRVNEGPWQVVPLDYNGGPDVWTLWHFDWQAEGGTHTLHARCRTQSGAQSHPTSEGDGDWSKGYDGSMSVTLEVT